MSVIRFIFYHVQDKPFPVYYSVMRKSYQQPYVTDNVRIKSIVVLGAWLAVVVVALLFGSCSGAKGGYVSKVGKCPEWTVGYSSR